MQTKKNPKHNIYIPNPATYEGIIHDGHVALILGMQGWFNSQKSINIYHVRRIKDKPHDYLNRCRKSI